jgi:hypothetical protein
MRVPIFPAAPNKAIVVGILYSPVVIYGNVKMIAPQQESVKQCAHTKDWLMWSKEDSAKSNYYASMEIEFSTVNVAPRLKRERETIRVMVQLFCRGQHHTTGGLCGDCESLLAYAMERLERCVYQDKKPTCANCPIHCYRKDRREQVRVMMRYAGPRMLFKHPILAILHIMDGKRKPPQNLRKRSEAS